MRAYCFFSCLIFMLASCAGPQDDALSRQFHEIALSVTRELGMQMLFTDPKIQTVRRRFETFGVKNAKSVWADDALYMVATLSDPSGERSFRLESLLSRYPDAREEPWSREHLSPYIPKITPLNLAARLELCDLFRRSRQHQKLTRLVAESAQKFPSHKAVFESFLAN